MPYIQTEARMLCETGMGSLGVSFLQNEASGRAVLVLTSIFTIAFISAPCLQYFFHYSVSDDRLVRTLYVAIIGLFCFICVPLYFCGINLGKHLANRYFVLFLAIIPIAISVRLSYGIMKTFDPNRILACFSLLTVALLLVENNEVFLKAGKIFQWPLYLVRIWSRANLMLLFVALVDNVT